MNLDTNKNFVDLSATAASKAHHLTDIKIDGDKIKLHGYAKVPVLGRIWSFVRHVYYGVFDSSKKKLQLDVDNFTAKHLNNVPQFLDDTLNGPANVFDDQIKKTNDYYNNIIAIKNKFASSNMTHRPFFAIALDKLDLRPGIRQALDNDFIKGDLGDATVNIAEVKVVAARVQKFMDLYPSLSEMASFTTRQEELQDFLNKYDTLVKIVDIFKDNITKEETSAVISDLRDIITKKDVKITRETEAFKGAMENLLPLLENDYSDIATLAEDFCDRFTELSKATELEQGIDAHIKQFTDATDPEKVVDGISIQKFEDANDVDGTETTSNKLNELKAHHDLWYTYNTYQGSKELIDLATITRDQKFFDDLIATRPDKVVALLLKMEPAGIDLLIQKLLPHVDKISNLDTKERLTALANVHCTLSEFVKFRVENTIGINKVDQFKTNLSLCNDNFKNLEDPSKIASNQNVKTLYEVVTKLNPKDLETYSPEMLEMCKAFDKNMKFWNTYLSYFEKQLTENEFGTLFRDLLLQKPKLAMDILATMDDNYINENTVKANALNAYLTWFGELPVQDTSLLLPQSKNERDSFISYLLRSNANQLYPNIMITIKGEVDEYKYRQLPAKFCTDLDIIAKQFNDAGANVEGLNEKIKEWKTGLMKPGPLMKKRNNNELVNIYEKKLNEFLQKISPKELLKAKELSNNIANPNENERIINEIYNEAFVRNIYDILIGVRRIGIDETPVLTMSSYFIDLANFDYEAAINLFNGRQDLIQDAQVESIMHTLTEIHKDEFDRLDVKIKDPIFQNASKRSFALGNFEDSYNYANKINNKKFHDDYTDTILLKMLKEHTWATVDNFREMYSKLNNKKKFDQVAYDIVVELCKDPKEKEHIGPIIFLMADEKLKKKALEANNKANNAVNK